jgi:hypothetical protein
MTKHRFQYTAKTKTRMGGFYEFVCNIEYEFADGNLGLCLGRSRPGCHPTPPLVTVTSIEVDHIVPSWTNYVYAYGWLKDRGWLPMVNAIAKRLLDTDPGYYQACLMKAVL